VRRAVASLAERGVETVVLELPRERGERERTERVVVDRALDVACECGIDARRQGGGQVAQLAHRLIGW
jgi:hypothetical protein